MRDELSINVAALEKGTRMVGPRLRDAIWVQGCSILRPGCANQAYLPNVERVRIPVFRLVAHFRARAGIIDGEPTEQPLAVGALLKAVKAPGLTTVVFSGRTVESLRRKIECRALLKSTDLLIDGPYVANQRDPALHWRGSSNQRLHLLSDTFNERDLLSGRRRRADCFRGFRALSRRWNDAYATARDRRCIASMTAGSPPFWLLLRPCVPPLVEAERIVSRPTNRRPMCLLEA